MILGAAGDYSFPLMVFFLFMNAAVCFATPRKLRFSFQRLAGNFFFFQQRFLHNNCGVII